MERTSKTLRKSIHIFLKNYLFFTTTPSLIALPFSISIFLSQSLLVFPINSLLPSMQNHFISISYVASFPPYFTLLILKLSQTITSTILIFPFTIFSLLLSKSLTILFLKNHQKTPSTSLFKTYTSILTTQLWNFLLIIGVNSTCFAIAYISFSLLDGIGYSSPNSRLVLSSIGAVLYAIIFANTLVIASLALILSGTEQNGGCLAIIKAFILIRGRNAAALALAIPVNLTFVAVESLFQYRVARAYYESRKYDYTMVLEGIFLAYLHSMSIVLDTIISYVFFKSCKAAYWFEHTKICNCRLKKDECCIIQI